MLISSDRHTRDDLELWREYEEADRVFLRGLEGKEKEAAIVAEQFAMRNRCYLGVSWGKDSVTVAHVCRDLNIPLVYVRQEPLLNPDCLRVRDAYLERYQPDYHEIVVRMRRGEGCWHATGTIEAGFKEAVSRFGRAHISGVRQDESGPRTMRMRTWGLTTKHTCCPIGYWSAGDVFAYLAKYDLPIHPAYAMLGGGRWERERLRVCSLGGRRGQGIGRREWELEYYGDHLRRIDHVET